MLWIDVKYASLIGMRLENFKIKKYSPFLANFNCFYCSDDRRRGYIIERSGFPVLHVFCHNCGKSTTLSRLVKDIDENLFGEYRLDRLKAAGTAKQQVVAKIEKPKVIDTRLNVLESLTKISSLRADHPAKRYVERRQIPTTYHYKLFYAPKFKTWVNSIIPRKFDSTKFDEPRLVIPFFDRDGRVFAFQGRSFDPKARVRYYTIVLDESLPRVYGLEKIDASQDVFVVEGPIDSMFLPNCVALAGGENSDIERVVSKQNAVFVFDNEPRNGDTVKRIEKAIDAGYRVVIFPDALQSKDINDMILKDGYSLEEVSGILHRNQFAGLAAKMRLINWKKFKQQDDRTKRHGPSKANHGSEA